MPCVPMDFEKDNNRVTREELQYEEVGSDRIVYEGGAGYGSGQCNGGEMCIRSGGRLQGGGEVAAGVVSETFSVCMPKQTDVSSD